MATLQQLRHSGRRFYSFAHNSSPSSPSHLRRGLSLAVRQHTSSTTRRNTSSTATPADKTIVLEQPDKFRPPSHAQRLVKGKKPNTFGSGYNQSSTPREQQAQRTKRYPHTFPNEGTFMHKFLTNTLWHTYITLAVLLFLASVSMVTTFRANSPFAHLLPPFSSLFTQPITFFSECWNTFVLDQDYNTAICFEERNQIVKDSQKRRLYRRAHGAEDGWEYDRGLDVRGIAPWDDGLTERERKAGKVDPDRKGDMPPEVSTELLLQKKAQEEAAAAERAREEAMREEQERMKRKRKVWFGIW